MHTAMGGGRSQSEGTWSFLLQAIGSSDSFLAGRRKVRGCSGNLGQTMSPDLGQCWKRGLRE